MFVSVAAPLIDDPLGGGAAAARSLRIAKAAASSGPAPFRVSQAPFLAARLPSAPGFGDSLRLVTSVSVMGAANVLLINLVITSRTVVASAAGMATGAHSVPAKGRILQS